MTTLFTIGHSDHPLEEFLGILTSVGIEAIVDVRKLPGSRAQPQFDEDVLSAASARAGIEYRHEASLGGLRPVSKTVPPEENGYWRNRSFHNYADYALSAEFADALGRLRDEGHDRRIAVMCAEAVWWRCHRRIIADHLLASGEAVDHVMGDARLQHAVLNPGAVVGADGALTYPQPV
ncbi:DUF488 domain-containing protein [Humibacter ginsenosidimutans]|uniref:DUF488 domain-containing protein n=1 Tax=Humibacter ginsenosidimutans TaxID=2599293 RepID=A0A5B8M462_9MICO|nr:DUF488 domain-containing protein [Humibacter ginsenosidimutans]QDZ14522.1 DUF488 domain-containing protein [Humibacter ginsenosidimutans]